MAIAHTDGPTTDHCPTCGRPISGIASAGPAQHRFRPCGHIAPPSYTLARPAGGR